MRAKKCCFIPDTLQLQSTLDPELTRQVIRFSQTGDTCKWKIRNSVTGELVFGSLLFDPVIDWGVHVGGKLGQFDVELTLDNPTLWGGVQLVKRRLLTVYKSPAGRTTHRITCTRDDLWTNPETSVVYTRSVVDGLTPAYGNMGNSVIVAGDVVQLSGYSPELRLRNLHGTPENPILVIPDTSLGDPFQIGYRKFAGLRIEYSEHVQIVGTPNSANLKYGFDFFVDPDPAIYAAAPGGKNIDINDFSTDIEVCGCDVHDSKFDGLSAKTDPDATRPSTWRNDPTGGFILKNLMIHHNVFRDTMGEGIYLGYFSYLKIFSALNSEGVMVDVYPHVHQDTKVYRNEFLNNGFDGIQIGNHISGVEVHDNLILGAGWQRTFGQCAAFSVNYMVGDIYNNTFEGNLIVEVPRGRLRIFNNTIGYTTDNFGIADPVYLDGIYMVQSGMPVWDYSTVPPVIVQSSYDYLESEVYIYHNTIRVPRTAVQLLGNYYHVPHYVGIVNNAFLFPLTLPTSESKLYNQMNIGNALGTTYEVLNNYMTTDQNAGEAKWESPDELKWKVVPGSVLLLGGLDLKSKFLDFTFTDGEGFTYPATDNLWHRGAYAFNPINYVFNPSSGRLFYRVWSLTEAKWLYAWVESEYDINPTGPPVGATGEIDPDSIVILVRTQENIE